jgi:hypothetical protein
MREKACVFVDGENLRHSLVDVFSDDGIFKPRDYLPATAEWGEIGRCQIGLRYADAA